MTLETITIILSSAIQLLLFFLQQFKDVEILKKRQLNIASAARVDQCQQSLGREIFICNQHPDEVDVFRSRCFERQITSLESQCGQ